MAAIIFSTYETGTILRSQFDKALKEANEGGAFHSLALIDVGIQVTAIPLPLETSCNKTETIQGCVDLIYQTVKNDLIIILIEQVN